MHTEEANSQKDKLLSDNLNLVNANLVKPSVVNKNKLKNTSK